MIGEQSWAAMRAAVERAYDGPDAGSPESLEAIDGAVGAMASLELAGLSALVAAGGAGDWVDRAVTAEVLRRVAAVDALARACALVAMAQDERDARARLALVGAFVDLRGDVGDGLTGAFVGRFAGDASASVRAAVAAVLGGIRDASAIATLIALSADEDASVRDWACFGLGHQLGTPGSVLPMIDTDALRTALAARLDDESEEAREEAATGLALRGDPRGIAYVEEALARFDEEGVTERVLVTAAEAPSPRYLASIEHVVREAPHLRAAVAALVACRAASEASAPSRLTCGPASMHVGCDCLRDLVTRTASRR